MSITKGEVDLSGNRYSYIETEEEISASKLMNLTPATNQRQSQYHRTMPQRSSRSNSANDRIAYKSPIPSGTCTFRDNTTARELNDQCKSLFQKLNSVGRSLAGICFGGCIFMSHQVPESTRQQVD